MIFVLIYSKHQKSKPAPPSFLGYGVLALAPIFNGDTFIMTYKERLYCWAIARLLPTQQWIIVARFRNRSDADGHLQLLRRIIPNVQFQVVFDIGVGN